MPLDCWPRWASRVAAVACLLAATLGGSGAAAQGTSTTEVLQAEIAVRDELISAQESLLNVYRCMFNVDTEVVTGGCANGKPRLERQEPEPFAGTPTQRDVDLRNQLVGAQETLLNVYRCMFDIDTQIVPNGCVDGRPHDGSATSEPVEVVNLTPGEGVQVKMGRANWSDGLIQAEIYRSLLQQLGYEVNELANATYHPRDFYEGTANGQFDFWANGRFPNHIPYLAQSSLSGVARPIGFQMRSGGLEGILADKATADAHGITRWDDIGDDPEIAALFDRDGNGKADIMGCDQGWACRTLIDDTIAANGWQDTIEQVSASHSELFAESLIRLQDGEPFLQFVWSPSAFTALMVPGVDVVWLSLDSPLANQQTAATLPAEQCPGQPCRTGSNAVDIRVVARNDFLKANPAAERLFELVAFPPLDISRLINEHMGVGSSFTETDVKNAAAEWIGDNQVTVDYWLAAARAVG